MASQQTTVDFIVSQLASAGEVSARKMFGEYGVYCDGKMPVLVCDDRMYVKPTDAGRAFAGGLEEAAPYPNAKPCLVVPEEKWEDGQWLSELVRLTAAELPVPKKRKPKRKS